MEEDFKVLNIAFSSLLEAGDLATQIFTELELLLFQSGDDIVKSAHFCLNHGVYILNMF